MPDLEKRLRLSRLRAECLLLSRRYGNARYDREDGTWVFIGGLPVPPGWNRNQVDVLIDVPSGTPGYPSVPPVWFWTNKDLRTHDGRPIAHFFGQGTGHADQLHVDRGWAHFCVHVEQSWRPSTGQDLRSGHSLLTYLDLIGAIFHDRKALCR